jgi:hypothetical protein
MTSSNIYLGVILVIAIIIIAHFAWRYWKQHRGKSTFSYATPATPRVRETVADLFATLKHMVVLGRSFEAQADGLAASTGTARAHVAGARVSASHLVRALDRAEKGLSGAPPTYANYLAVYRGLSSTDATLLAAADAYVEAGRHVHQSMVLMVPGSHDSDLAALGNTLLGMGAQLRHVVRAVHRLGVSLDLE